eukprot:1407935-Amphidinium_carterae.1
MLRAEGRDDALQFRKPSGAFVACDVSFQFSPEWPAMVVGVQEELVASLWAGRVGSTMRAAWLGLAVADLAHAESLFPSTSALSSEQLVRRYKIGLSSRGW